MKEVRLSDVCEIKNGYAFKSTEYTDRGTPLIRISNFDDGFVQVDKNSIFVSEKNLNSKRDFVVEKGDLLIALSGATTGKYGIYNYDFPSLLNQRIGLFKSGSSSKIKNKYFYFLLGSLKSEILRQAGGAAQPNISTKKIGEIKILLPPLHIQERIAGILDAADTLRQKDQALLIKYDDLAQSLFLDMFGDPITNPKGWKKRPMGELMTIVRGGSPRPIDDYLGGDYPWIKIGDATKGDDMFIYKTKESIIKEGLKKTRFLKSGSLIFANCGVSLGFARILKIDGCIHDGWLAFSDFNSSISKIFLLKALNSITRYFQETAPDGTQPNLNTSIMKNFNLILPPLELQKKFEISLEILQKERILVQTNIKKSEDLFQSLLQRAFKGELVDELETNLLNH